MNKREFSIAFVIIAAAAIIYGITSGTIKFSDAPNKQNFNGEIAKVANPKTPPDNYKADTWAAKGEAYIPKERIYSIDEAVEVETMGNEYVIKVSNPSYSRKLEGNYKFKESLSKIFGNVFEKDGTIKSGYYYLYIDVSVTNLKEKCNLILNMINCVILDENNIAHYGFSLQEDDVFNYCESGRVQIGMVEGFEKGETVEFSQVFIVPEESINQIAFLVNDNGKTGDLYLNEPQKKFVKLSQIKEK